MDSKGTIKFDTLLSEIEAAALTVKPKQPNAQALSQIWEASYVIQQMALAHGFADVHEFMAHIQELVAQIRAGDVPVTDHFPSIILASAGQIRILLEAARGGIPVDLSLQAALLETIFQMTGPTPPLAVKSRPPDAEATFQDAVVLPAIESLTAR